MEDIIDIIVTETTNLIEITSQPTDEIIDVNIIDNREDITLNVTPTVVEININSLTGNFGVNWGDIEGTLSNQTDLQNVLNAKADLVDGKVPSSQLPSYVDDVIEVANYASLPVTGEIGKIYITLDTNFIYRWSGSTYIEIKDSSAVWGAITGTLSNQTDLQSALDAKVPYTGATGNVNLGEYGATVGYLGFDTTPTSTPTGIGTTYWDSFYRTLSLIDGDGDTTLQIGQEQRVLVHNNTGSTLTDGQVVYVIGSTGELPSVALASNTSEATSSVTFGIVTESIAHGANGFITTSGIIHGLNTNAYDEGAAIYLGSTAGTFTQTKPVAPANSVLVGYIIKKSGGNGSIFVKIQNGYELEELHDVLITSKANNDGLFYESSTSLWKNKSIATVLGYTPANDASVVKLTGSQSIAGDKRFLDNAIFDFGIGLRTPAGLYQYFEALNGGGYRLGVVTAEHDFYFSTANNYSYTFPAASGTIALTSNLSAYLPLGGGTMTGVLFGASASFSGFVGFGGNTSPLAAIDVTGAGIFSSSVTATRLILSGGTSPTGLYFGHTNKVVLANYTVGGGIDFETNGGNVTMQLSSVGVLSTTGGASFSGALNGTSATFSGAVELAGTQLLRWGLDDGSANARTWGIRNGYNASGDLVFLSSSTNNTTLNTVQLQIARSGAATFSGSVSATSVALNGSIANSGDAATLTIKQTSTSYNNGIYLERGGERNGYHIYIGGASDSLTFRRNYFGTQGDVMSLTRDGNVGIGTTAPSFSNTGTGLNVQSASGDGAYLKVNYSGGNSAEFRTGFSVAGIGNVSDNPFQFFTNNTERMRITSGGDTQIAAGKAIYCYGTDAKSYGWTNLADGNLSFTSVQFGVKATIGAFSGTYTALSDVNKKKDFEESVRGLDSILGLKPTLYRYKDDVNNDFEKVLGFIAQEVKDYIPEAYVETGTSQTKFIGLDYNAITATLVKAVQELKAELDTISGKV